MTTMRSALCSVFFLGALASLTTAAEDMANGADVLLRTVLAIDGGALDAPEQH